MHHDGVRSVVDHAALHETGGERYVLCSLADVTTHVAMQARADASDALYRAVLTAITDIVVVLDRELRVVFLNEAAKRRAEFSDACLGAVVTDVFPPVTAYADELRAILRGGVPVTLRKVSDRLRRLFELRCYPAEDQMTVIAIDVEDDHRMAERLRTVVENQDEFVCCATVDHTLTYVNAAVEHAMGRSRRDILGTRWTDIVDPQDLPAVLAPLAALTPTNPKSTLEHRMHLRGRDRLIRWTRTAVFDTHGDVIEYVGIGIDVTEAHERTAALHAAVAEKELLLRELHHRVKNNLQVVASLIGMRIGTITDPSARQFVADIEARIQAMALIHEHLHQARSLREVPARALLAGVIDASLRAHVQADVGIDLDIDDVTLEFDDAVVLGRILHEVVVNTLEHAFPDGSGRLAVALKQHPGELCLVVVDDGVGVPRDLDVTKLRSLGLRMVQGIVQNRRGRFTIERDGERGTRVTVCLPPLPRG